MRASSSLDTEFRSTVLESIDETIRALLGDESQRVLFKRLSNDFHLTHGEIPDRLRDFQAALTTLLGAGGIVLMRAIIRRLCSALEIAFIRNDENDFEAYVADCMRRCRVNSGRN